MVTDRPRQTTEAALADLVPLCDPVRRALYLYVADKGDEVGRDEAAEAVGVARRLAAFHLDKLVEAGFLQASFRRLGGRSGRGAGRPSKLYTASGDDRMVTLPHRDYGLAADLMAEALQGAEHGSGGSSLREVARRFGRRVGAEVTGRIGRRASHKRRAGALVESLAAFGYQPYHDGADVRLRNCPFHALAERHRELVCGMNLALLEGVLEGMEGGTLDARRVGAPSGCCVAIGTVGGG
jgi:predicted ArsR family transcriptional regulator